MKTLTFCSAFGLLVLLAAPADAAGPQQKTIVVNVEPETNYWPAVIGAIGALGAAAVGVVYRRKR